VEEVKGLIGAEAPTPYLKMTKCFTSSGEQVN
jgi:hypothetical protein